MKNKGAWVYHSDLIDLVQSRRFYKGYALVDRALLQVIHDKLVQQGQVEHGFETVNNQHTLEEGNGGNDARTGYRRFVPMD